MSDPKTPSFLKLVHSVPRPEITKATTLAFTSVQGTFLPSNTPTTLIFLPWKNRVFEQLLDVLKFSKPKIIFDLRIVPRFETGSLSRRYFFDLLQRNECQYIDLFGRMDISDPNSALINPTLVAEYVTKFTNAADVLNIGPFVFLHDESLVHDSYVGLFAQQFSSLTAKGWNVYRAAQGDDDDQDKFVANPTENGIGESLSLSRRTIFISHATPGDNDFVHWLSFKLMAAGYEVWSDIGELKGGDSFWTKIEEIIRLKAAKVVFVQSAQAKGRGNLRKEVYLALKVGDNNRLPRFVVPMKIDETPFEDTLIELIDVQSINCSANWLSGLRDLLVLLERDNVPRASGIKSDEFSAFVETISTPAVNLTAKPESLLSNWLPIKSEPAALNFFSCRSIADQDLRRVASELKVPAFPYFKFLVTPASQDALTLALQALGYQEAELQHRASVLWVDFLQCKYGDLPSWKYAEARNFAFELLNRAWSICMEDRGLTKGTLANGRFFWFLKHDQLRGDEIKFPGYHGKMIRRQLVGFSKKKNVHWHFGAQARVSVLEGKFYYSITPHVVFSSNGSVPLPSKAQQHSLRRSFCKSWWNNRWRDLLSGYLYFCSDGLNEINVDIGASEPMSVSATFFQFHSNISPLANADLATAIAVDSIIDEVGDFSDDDDDEFFDAIPDSIEADADE